MNHPTVKCIEYREEIWAYHQMHPALADFLAAKDCLIILRHGEPPFKVVLGVPHQAAVGEEQICEKRTKDGKPDPRPSDENAASYAPVAFTALRDCNIPCKLVIMAHATTGDPNKGLTSPYFCEILADDTELLFECHGAGPDRDLALELSAGKNRHVDTVRFGYLLAAALGHRYRLGVQKEAGKTGALTLETDGTEREGKLERPALETCSLTTAGNRGIAALHLEAKPAFRKPTDGSNAVTPDGLILGRAVAQAIISYFSDPTGEAQRTDLQLPLCCKPPDHSS